MARQQKHRLECLNISIHVHRVPFRFLRNEPTAKRFGDACRSYRQTQPLLQPKAVSRDLRGPLPRSTTGSGRSTSTWRRTPRTSCASPSSPPSRSSSTSSSSSPGPGGWWPIGSSPTVWRRPGNLGSPAGWSRPGIVAGCLFAFRCLIIYLFNFIVSFPAFAI